MCSLNSLRYSKPKILERRTMQIHNPTSVQGGGRGKNIHGCEVSEDGFSYQLQGFWLRVSMCAGGALFQACFGE